jgi:hypothetical protein
VISGSLLAQKVIVGEYVQESIATGHPYAKAKVQEGQVSLLQSDTVTYPGATYIALHFARFDLAPGDFVVVRSGDFSQKWTYSGLGRGDLGLSDQGFFATHIKGETAVIELYSDNHHQGYGYEIDFYGRGYSEEEIQYYWDQGLGEEMNLPRPKGDSRSVCTSDDTEEVKCYETSDPEAYDKARAVCRLTLNGNAHCTGWLIGSEGHIMTNEHCIGSQSELNNIDFEFMAEGATCATNCASSLACPGVIEASGGTLISVNAPYDFALVLPDTSVNGNTDLVSTYGYMQLRESGAVVGERLYIAQHPAGWGKRLAMLSSYSEDTGGFARVYSIDEEACSGGASDVDVGYWADTQGGSSGSPVLGYSDNRVIALHHCRGNNSCTSGNPGSDDPNRGVPIQDVIAALGPDLPDGATCDPPEAPTGLSAQTNGDNRIDLTWNPVTGADSYVVYRAQGSCGTGTLEKIADQVATPAYSDTNVSGDITYNYQVKAFIESTSCTGTFSTCADETATGVCTLPPLFDGVDEVVNAYTPACGIALSWNAATPQCSGPISYTVYRSEVSGFTPDAGTQVACLTETTYLDQSVLPDTMYYYIVRAEDGSGNGSGPCVSGNQETNTVELGAFASGPNQVMFADDLENGPDQFVFESGPSSGGTPWALIDGTDPLFNHYHSPTHSLHVVDATSAAEEMVRLAAPVMVPNQLGTILRWFHEVEIEDRYDGGVLEYSLDLNTWYDILEGNDGVIPDNANRFLQNGYNMTLNTTTTNVLSARDAWSGDLGGYHEVLVDLTDFADQNVYFRWRLGTDGSVGDTGWYLDDIEVLYPTLCSGGSPILTIDSVSGAHGQSVQVGITMHDNGTNPESFAFDVAYDPMKLEYLDYLAGEIGNCAMYEVSLTEEGLIHVSANCASLRTIDGFVAFSFHVNGFTGNLPVEAMHLAGDLAGQSVEHGAVILAESVNPCEMNSMVYHDLWRQPMLEPDFDLDDDGLISILDIIHQLDCQPTL